jgi:hypothetical protein
MQKTIAVLIFFVAAVLAGLFAQTMSVAPTKEMEVKETFMQKERGMPLDMQAAGGVTGYAGTSPILGSEPKPISEKPYEMANDQELFIFEGNRISADCCPSPFSTDTGCVCLTDAQRAEFASRGGNRA